VCSSRPEQILVAVAVYQFRSTAYPKWSMTEVEKASLSTAVAHGSVSCKASGNATILRQCNECWIVKQGAGANVPTLWVTSSAVTQAVSDED